MRLKLVPIIFGITFLLIAGFRTDALPYGRGDDVQYSDAVLAHWPNALFLRESVLNRHTFPVWRETTMAG